MMRLGSYVFYWNADVMSIPGKQRSIAEVDTYKGSAIFLWDALIQGTPIVLEWDWMPTSQYAALNIKYLEGSTYEFNPDTGGNSYNVIVKSLTGKYFKTLLNDIGYRRDVKLILSVRSGASTTTTTTTTTTSTTVTASTTTSSTVTTTSSSTTTTTTNTASTTTTSSSTTSSTTTSSSTTSSTTTTNTASTTTTSSSSTTSSSTTTTV